MHNSKPAAVVLPVLYEGLLLGSFHHNIGLARSAISASEGKLHLFGLPVIFVFNAIEPWFVLTDQLTVNETVPTNNPVAGPDRPE